MLRRTRGRRTFQAIPINWSNRKRGRVARSHT